MDVGFTLKNLTRLLKPVYKVSRTSVHRGAYLLYKHLDFYPLHVVCSGILPQAEPPMVEVDLETPESTDHNSAAISDVKEERTTISKL